MCKIDIKKEVTCMPKDAYVIFRTETRLAYAMLVKEDYNGAGTRTCERLIDGEKFPLVEVSQLRELKEQEINYYKNHYGCTW